MSVPRAVRLAEGLDEAQLVAAARSGDRTAFEALYHLYARMVAGIVLARVAPDEVDDLVQDVFLQAIARLHTLRDPGAFGGWLATIARNRVADHHRRSADLTELPNDLSTNDPDRAEALSILAILQGLPDAYRETLILRLVEGMTGPEIAERTGLTPASVRVNLHRGMKLLRQRLGKEEPS